MAEADAPRTLSVVLDEQLDLRLRHHFGPGVRVETAQYRGWKGLVNGALMRALAAAGDVDVFVTGDQGIPDQQPVPALPFAVVVLRTHGDLALDNLLPLMAAVRRLLPALRPGTVTWVDRPPGGRPV